jgi:glycosyltransferase involved in cell wall biosynthesis
MLFSVDAHAIGRHLTGNEVYVRNLLQEFAIQDQPSRFVAYVSGPEAPESLPSTIRIHAVSRNPFVRLGFDLTRLLRRDCPDLIHVQYTSPFSCPVPVVVTVHDVSYIERPEFFSAARAAQLQFTVERTVRSAARILAPSEFSRQAIAKCYGLDPDRIAVIPNAADSRFRPIPQESARAVVRRQFDLGHPFILTVGDLQPRKNQAGLVKAFAGLIRAYPALPHHLVLAGKESWKGARVREAVAEEGIADRVHFTGFVSDEELLFLYNACEFFVFPSFYEGFGIPLLEAMRCGRAVACSNTAALPEVADGAGIFFAPHSVPEMVRALRDLALDSELRARMERLGLSRAAQFGWGKAASSVLDIYYAVAGQRRSPQAAPREKPVAHS